MKQHHDIIIVDNDEEDIMMIREFFEKSGDAEPLKTISSGKGLFDYLDDLSDEDYPSLVILDYNMPPYNGNEVLSHLKSDGRYLNIPVIIYTTVASNRIKAEVISKGAIFCIEKASSPQSVMEQVKYFRELVE